MHVEERRYEILGPLGKGGFGTVYRARYLGEGGFTQVVALKVLNREMSEVEEVASRLRDEARVLGLVRHRAIVQVHRLARLNGAWTVVMEYVHGVDLAQVIRAGNRVPIGPALEIAGEVAGALHVAWTAAGQDGRPLRLLHRDIKPSNIQVTEVGEVKVLDFGIARADFDSREAHTRNLAYGSAEYMAPERLDLMDGPASDVYSLGAVLYELLTGRAFGRTSASERRHTPRVEQGLVQLAAALPRRADEVVALVGSMLHYDPGQRPTAREVERTCLELQRGAGDEPLRFWAEAVVPRVRATVTEQVTDALTGSIMVEHLGQGTSAEPVAARTPPPRGSGDTFSLDGPASFGPSALDAPSLPPALVPQAAPPRPVALPPHAPNVTLAVSLEDLAAPVDLAAMAPPAAQGEGHAEPAATASPSAAPAPRPTSDPGPASAPWPAPEPPPAADQRPAPDPAEADLDPHLPDEPAAFIGSDTDPLYQLALRRKRDRTRLVVGALGVLLVGVVGAILLSRGGEETPTARSTAEVAASAPTASPPATQPELEAAAEGGAAQPLGARPVDARPATTPAATPPPADSAPSSAAPAAAPSTGAAAAPSTGSAAAPSTGAAAAPSTGSAAAPSTGSAGTPSAESSAGPSAAEPTPGLVQVTGNTGLVELRSGGRSYIVTGARELPPGTYTVLADFGSGTRHAAGQAVVRAGETTQLVCDAAFQECNGR